MVDPGAARSLQKQTGGREGGSGHGAPVSETRSNVTALNPQAFAGGAGAAVALREESEPHLSPAERIEQLPWREARPEAKIEARNEAKAYAAEKRAEAKAKGYEGEACGECGNFTLVRNGTCMKCDTCGSTTGCS